jgi:hypothetical protein
MVTILIRYGCNLWCRYWRCCDSAACHVKAIDTPQAFGSFYESNGQKYCAISVLSKFLGYDIAAEKKIQNDKDANPEALFPYTILEMIENLAAYGNPRGNPKCFCYYYSLISLLIHLNDYHRMTFTGIGNWLESKDMR